MDHRISKDMISSGMIPSGEKNQEDLNRTQYGTAPSPSALSDGYKSMYDKKEEVINEHHKKDADGNTIPHEDEEVNEGKIPAGLQAYLDKKKGKKEDKKEVKEEVDKFNIVYNHFISEGYSEKEAYSKMANLTEEQLDEFVGAAMAGLKAVGGLMAKKGIGGALKTVGAKVGSKIGGSAGRKLGYKAGSAIANNPMTSYYMAKDLMPGGGGGGNPQPMMSKRTSTVSASADLFDIVKGQLIDEGLSEEEIKDIMLPLTPDEIIKELEESSLSAGSSDGHYSDGGDGVFRSKQQIGNMFNKNIPTKKQTGGKVDKMTRKSINTSARELGIQGPTTLKQSVEPEGETI